MTLNEAILATLSYSDHFSFPLTLPELYVRLIKTRRSQAELKLNLKKLLSEKKIAQTNEFFHLPGRQGLVARRLRAHALSAVKITKAKWFAQLLAHIPSILGIFLTGSLAVTNAKKDDDIDFMIITKNNQLWTTRLIVTLITECLGLRRHPFAKRAENKLCLNLYLSPSALSLPASKRSLYTAYELMQAVPLYDPYNTQALLLTANPWIHQYLPNVLLRKSLPIITSQPSPLLSFFESLAYYFQRWYMQSKLTRELITPHAAFFHPYNPGKTVLKSLQSSMK